MPASTALRLLYKYLYFLTQREKTNNPDWGTFLLKMDALYSERIQSKMDKKMKNKRDELIKK